MDVISEIITVVFLGLVLGSFATAMEYRIPLGISWVTKRSSCPLCNTVLGVLDLVPVFSWCLNKGECRHCKAKISVRYPLIEISSVILCLLAYSVFGLGAQGIVVISVVPFLLALLLIDFKHMILPNQLVGALFLLGAVRLLIYWSGEGFLTEVGSEILINYVLAAIIFALISWGTGALVSKMKNKESLGFGDVKFFGAAGIWLGLELLPLFMIVSGGLAVFLALLWRYIKKSDVFPFGPALISAFIILLFYQGILLS